MLATTVVWFVTLGDYSLLTGLRLALEVLAWTLGTGPMPAWSPACNWMPEA